MAREHRRKRFAFAIRATHYRWGLGDIGSIHVGQDAMNAAKLAKVLALAASDNEAEAVQALRALRRMVESQGSDLVALAGRLADGPEILGQYDLGRAAEAAAAEIRLKAQLSGALDALDAALAENARLSARLSEGEPAQSKPRPTGRGRGRRAPDERQYSLL